MVVNGGRGKPRAANLHCRPDLSRPLRMSPTDILTLTRGTIPLLVSFPHAGTDIPPSIARRMTPAALLRADTDWHLPRLYGFAQAMGASTLVPHHSRYVIDLNRPPQDTNLYPGQDTTSLVPVDTFRKEPLYPDGAAP